LRAGCLTNLEWDENSSNEWDSVEEKIRMNMIEGVCFYFLFILAIAALAILLELVGFPAFEVIDWLSRL